MQEQMGGISSTKADKLLKKAKKMNDQMFNEGGVKMTKKGEDPFKGDKPTGKTDEKGRKEYRRSDGTTYYRLFGGDDEKTKRNMGGTARSNNAKKSRGAGAMIKGTTFRGVY